MNTKLFIKNWKYLDKLAIFIKFVYEEYNTKDEI